MIGHYGQPLLDLVQYVYSGKKVNAMKKTIASTMEASKKAAEVRVADTEGLIIELDLRGGAQSGAIAAGEFGVGCAQVNVAQSPLQEFFEGTVQQQATKFHAELQAGFMVAMAKASAVPKLLARIVESLAQTYHALDRAQRETVDAMDDNAEAALYLLARVDTKHSDSSAIEAIAAFDARSALERLAGGLIRPTELAKRTGWSRQSILDWSNANRLLAVEDNGRRKYPQCQFDDKGNMLKGLDCVLGALASNGVRGWMALDFLFSIDPATGETPIWLLRSGRIDEAVNSGKIFGEQGAA
jgi:hypothetical protein